jgi:hypothetical protein
MLGSLLYSLFFICSLLIIVSSFGVRLSECRKEMSKSSLDSYNIKSNPRYKDFFDMLKPKKDDDEDSEDGSEDSGNAGSCNGNN